MASQKSTVCSVEDMEDEIHHRTRELIDQQLGHCKMVNNWEKKKEANLLSGDSYRV
jgi:hypothetical protein